MADWPEHCVAQCLQLPRLLIGKSMPDRAHAAFLKPTRPPCEPSVITPECSCVQGRV